MPRARPRAINAQGAACKQFERPARSEGDQTPPGETHARTFREARFSMTLKSLGCMPSSLMRLDFSICTFVTSPSGHSRSQVVVAARMKLDINPLRSPEANAVNESSSSPG